MPNKHLRNPIPFRPPAEARAWLEAQAETTGQPVNAILTEALTVYRAFAESVAEGPGWALRLQDKLEGSK